MSRVLAGICAVALMTMPLQALATTSTRTDATTSVAGYLDEYAQTQEWSISVTEEYYVYADNGQYEWFGNDYVWIPDYEWMSLGGAFYAIVSVWGNLWNALVSDVAWHAGNWFGGDLGMLLGAYIGGQIGAAAGPVGATAGAAFGGYVGGYWGEQAGTA